MAGRVDYVDRMAVPFAGYGGGLDGDAALALLHHEVGGCVAVMHVAVLVDLAGVEKYPLGCRGLSRIYVGDNADVAYVR